MYMGLCEHLGDNPRSPLPLFHVFFCGTLSSLNIGKKGHWLMSYAQDLTTGLGTFRQALEGHLKKNRGWWLCWEMSEGKP